MSSFYQLSNFVIILGILAMCLMAIGMAFFVLLFQKKFAQQQLANQQMLLEASVDSQERERQRIAEELHDGVGTMLAATKLLVSRLSRHDNDQLEGLQELKDMLTQTIHEVRTISRGLSPLSLQRIGLVEALDKHCTLLSNASGVRVMFTHEAVTENNDFRAELALYRIAQELIHNALKHANPTYVWVYLSVWETTLYLEVSNDGRGFDLTTDKQRGIGLLDIKNRLAALQGHIIQKGATPLGSSLIVSIPLERYTNSTTTQ